MDWQKNCAAVIPCRDEAPHIGALVAAVRAYLPAVWVVDDGSVDETAALAERAGGRVCRLPSNQGKGAALRAGVAECVKHGFRWALLLDGDGQHRPEDIPAFWAGAERTQARMIVGNRMHSPAALPWLRYRVNRWMSRRIGARVGVVLPDTQCGFRLVDLAAWSGLELRTSHYEIESEMLVAFLGAGHAVEFVPIQAIGRGPGSRIRPVVDSWRWLRWWMSAAARPRPKRGLRGEGRADMLFLS